jgi:hypothetical protein
MTAFTPTQSTLEPAAPPDPLSSAVLHSLSRPIYGRVAWGPMRSFFLAAISFGIIPLIVWPRQFGRFVVAEQQQFWHLIEWLRVRTGDTEAAELRDSLRDTGAAPSLWFVPMVLLGILIASFMPIVNLYGLNFQRFIDATYGAASTPFDGLLLHRHFHHGVFAVKTFKIWTLCLSAGYLSHWLHVRHHASTVNQMLRRLNPILRRQHLPPVAMFSTGIGLRFFWIVAGLIGLSMGAVWAIPAAFAGAVHQRYVRRTSTRIRGELAMRASAALARQRPAIDVPMPNGFRVVCSNVLCGKTLASGSSFCPRCGTRVSAADAVA